MSHFTIDQLVDQLKNGQLNRRGFVKQATALGVSAAAAGMMARNAGAQDASPAAGGTGAVKLTSITRDEFNAALAEEFDFSGATPGGEIIQVDTTDIQTLNATLTDDVYSSWIVGLLYDGIVGTNPIDGTDAPGLADYWEILDDDVTYTFYLNENAKWQDGTPLTSADVEFTFNSVLAEDSLSVRRATVASTLKELIVIDDKTFQWVALAPSATFGTDTAGQFGILPKHIWENVPFADFGADPGSTGQDPSRVVGSGAFKFVEWVLNDHVTVEKDPDYWDTSSVANIDRYIFRVQADGNAALQSVITGESDVLVGVPYAAVEPTRQSNPDLSVIDYDTTLFNFYHTFQGEGALFADVNLRQALHFALDRQLVADIAYQGFAEPAMGTQPVLSVAYAPDRINTIYSYDPDRAGQLLDEAGWVLGDDGVRAKDGTRLSFEMIYSEGVPTYEQQVPYMQQAWRDVGIEMVPTQIPFPTLSDQVSSGNYQMCLQGFQWSVDGGQIIMFGCDYTPPAGFNRMHYCNPAYDELELAAIVEVDPAARVELLIEASNIVNDEAAVGVMVFRKEVTAIGPRVHNFYPNGYSTLWSITKTWVDQ